MKIVSSSDPQYSRVLRQVCQRSVQHNAKTNQTVKQILQSVERSGDAAVVRYVRKFDGIQMRPKDFPVSRVEIQRAYAEVSKEELQALYEKDFSIERLEHVRDIFLFCCYTGLSYADVRKLTPNNPQTLSAV